MNQPLSHHLLHEEVLKKLEQHKITSIGMYLLESDRRLKEITGLSEQALKLIRENFRTVYEDGSIVSKEEHMRHIQLQEHIIPTGLKNLDDLLDGGIPMGSIIELSGDSCSGKTQFCNTLAIHLLTQHGINCYWLDTKMDFNTVRCERILNLNYPNSDAHKLLNRIYVQRAFDKESFLNALRGLVAQADKGLLIIDSVTALINLYLGPQYKEREDCIVQMMNCVRKLCVRKEFIVIFTTLGGNEVSESNVQGSQEKNMWQGFSSERFYLTHFERDPEKLEISTIRNSNKRLLYLIKSNTGRSIPKMPLTFNITDEGVVLSQ